MLKLVKIEFIPTATEEIETELTGKWKMIRVTADIHKDLVKLAKYGDSMSDIIGKLLESYHNDKSKEKGTSKKK